MAAPWRVTCVQMPTEVVWPLSDRAEVEQRIQENISIALGLIDQALRADPPPQLILLPEYAFTGQPNNETVLEWLDKACFPVPGPLTGPFQEKARRAGVYIAGNQFERDPEWGPRFFNTSWLVDPAGDVILRYRRVHTAQWCSPHDVLDDYVERYGWDGLWPVADTPLGRIAMIPCAEISVPEAVRSVTLRGAEILLHPTWEPRTVVQDAAKTLAAANNLVYVVSANVSGAFHRGRVENAPRTETIGGGSRIIDYRGRTMSEEPETRQSVAVSAMLDIGALRSARSDMSMANRLAQLRTEAVRTTYERVSIYPPNAFRERPLQRWNEIDGPRKEAVNAISALHRSRDRSAVADGGSGAA